MKNIIISLSACFFIAAVIFLLDCGADNMYEIKTMKQVGSLVEKRAETMNAYYSGELEYIHAEEILMDILSGELLEDDLYNLKAWEHTDIDMVNDAEIIQVILTEEDDNFLSARVSVSWNVSGLEGNEMFDVTYETVCEKNGKTLKLSQFF